MRVIRVPMMLMLLVGLVSGCSRPYDQPVVALGATLQQEVPFPGLVSLVRSSARSNPDGLQILWAHGMCSHSVKWLQDRSARLNAAVGGEIDVVQDDPETPGKLSLHVRRFRSSAGVFSSTFVLWSPMTAGAKESLSVDTPGTNPETAFPYQRARLNGTLKVGLINDCLADAVVYLGPNGDLMRDAFKGAVCRSLGGAYTRQGSCDLATAQLDQPVAIVTESLGSKFVFDAVRALWLEASQSPDTARRDRLATRLSAITSVYLVSNQIPLLDLAGRHGDKVAPNNEMRTGQVGSSLEEFLSIVRSAHALARRAPRPLTVVAFSDPSDLLSYRIVPSRISLPEGATLVNVTVSNADTYLGYLENPLDAHCGYAWNSRVIGLLVEGYAPGSPIPVSPTLPKGNSCL